MNDTTPVFTMLGGEGVVCEGDVCTLPGADQASTATA
jgi:hypothetical protein